jgi:hypothetical protein
MTLPFAADQFFDGFGAAGAALALDVLARLTSSRSQDRRPAGIR